MLLAAPLLSASFLAVTVAAHGRSEIPSNHTSSDFLDTCHEIAKDISGASQVFFPLAPQYTTDISHPFFSASQNSTCSVEPGTVKDVSKIIKILGSRRTPFAVKSGGHTGNLGFSSTPGVQIAMARFNDITILYERGTVNVGAGLAWDDVYKVLSPIGLNVVGGRRPGIGVGGLTLGGGYSFQTSQYGLTIDNIAGYELVLPNGDIKQVTAKDKDLWFGLRGGLNNFGIVTRFLLKTHPQTNITGGVFTYAADKQDQIRDAFVKFQHNGDTKAVIVFGMPYSSGQLKFTVTFVYDAPTVPAGIFDDFLAIQSVSGKLATMSYSDFVLSRATTSNPIGRGTRHATSVTEFSPKVFDALVNQTVFWGKFVATLDKTAGFTSTLEPFDLGLFSHGSGSAYPPDRSHPVVPADLSASWVDPSIDAKMADVLRESIKAVHEVALADGQKVAHSSVYSNYALSSTPLEHMFGKNLPRLRKIKKEIDPDKVMDLAGGFRF